MRYQEGGPVGPARPVGPEGAYLAENRAQNLRAQAAELEQGSMYPNVAERIVRFIRDTLAAIVLLLLIVMAILSLRFLTQVGNAVDDLAPGPAATGCPFGPGECGG